MKSEKPVSQSDLNHFSILSGKKLKDNAIPFLDSFPNIPGKFQPTSSEMSPISPLYGSKWEAFSVPFKPKVRPNPVDQEIHSPLGSSLSDPQ